MQKKDYYDLLKYKYLSFYEDALKISRGQLPTPRMATWHLNYKCSFKCPDCKFLNDNENLKAENNFKKDKIIIKSISKLGVSSVDLSGGGEPLLNKNIISIINGLSSEKINIGVLTNGIHLKGKIASAVLKKAFYVRIGIDASTSSVFEKVKGVSPEVFKNVISNIKDIVELRRKIKSDCEITLKFALNGLNIHQLNKMVELAYNLKVDAVFLKLYENTNTPVKDKVKYQKTLEKLKKNYNNKIPVLGDIIQKGKIEKCWLSPLQFCVDMFGDIYICSYYSARKKEHKIGNLFQKNIEQIWGSPQHKAKLKKINRHLCAKYNCKLHTANLNMKELMVGKNKLSFV